MMIIPRIAAFIIGLAMIALGVWATKSFHDLSKQPDNGKWSKAMMGLGILSILGGIYTIYLAASF
jgi:hypothetical protein